MGSGPLDMYKGAIMKYLMTTAAAISLSACATFTDGASQNITLESNAANATCSITQNGNQIVAPAPVPATHRIERRPGDLIVDCSAPGHAPAKLALVNGKHAMTVTGILLTGVLVNVGTDAISHSWHEAQDKAYVYLKKN